MAAMGTTVHCASEVTAEDGKRKEFPERQRQESQRSTDKGTT